MTDVEKNSNFQEPSSRAAPITKTESLPREFSWSLVLWMWVLGAYSGFDRHFDYVARVQP